MTGGAKAPIKLLGAPDYSAKERRALIDFVLALRKSLIQDFLKRVELSRSGTKQDLRERLQDALDRGELTYERLVDFLDSVAPWGKQHVFLYQGPRGDVQMWKDPSHTQHLLKQHRLGKLFNARLPLILPEKLTLSSVTHTDGRLRVTAIEKRDYTERTPEHDEEKEAEGGERITLKAYTHHVTRTLAAFEWDLNANVAMLQITQLPEDGDYEKLAEQFAQLVKPWLDIKLFGAADLRPVIDKLHEIEKNGQAEARSHGIDYRSLQGRRVSARRPIWVRSAVRLVFGLRLTRPGRLSFGRTLWSVRTWTRPSVSAKKWLLRSGAARWNQKHSPSKSTQRRRRLRERPEDTRSSSSFLTVDCSPCLGTKLVNERRGQSVRTRVRNVRTDTPFL